MFRYEDYNPKGIPMRVYSFLTEEVLQQDYEELGNFRLIAEKYKIPRSTVERYIKSLGIKTIPKIQYTCDDNFFTNDTEEIFYMAGFIAADGCILQNKSKEPNCIQISLSRKDEGFLIKLKDTLKFSGPISYKFNNLSKYNDRWNDCEQSRFTIYSKQMIDDLKRFGIGQRKSLTYEFPNWLMGHNLVNHFMRGYVDGDGSFYIGKERKMTKKFGMREYSKFVFNLRGTESFLNSFKSVLHEKTDLQSVAKPEFNNGIYMLRFGGNPSVSKISDFLYGDASIYLERKYNIIKNFLTSKEEA